MADVLLDERLAERRREVRRDRRRHRLKRTLTIVGVLVLLGVAALVERSSLVALEEVRVVGTGRLDPAAVRDAADLELGTSTVRLRLGAAEERVEKLPLVADATLRRVDPLTVEVAVTERVPVIVAVRPNGLAVLIDEDGVVVAEGTEPDLVVIEVAAPGALPGPGERAGAHAALGNAHRVATQLSGPLRAEVERYVAHGERNVDLVLHDGRRVRFGAAERIDEKARALGAVLEDLGDTPVSLIDVRAPSTPTIVRSP